MPATLAQIRPLIYSLCEQRKLPVLVTDLIARYLDEQDLLIISLLSSTLNQQANSIIHKDISLDLSEEHSWRRLTPLLRTLLTTPTALSNVRSLSLIDDPLSGWREETVRYGDSVEAPLRRQIPPELPLDLTTFTLAEFELYQKAGSLQTTTPSSDRRTTLPRLCLDIIKLLCYRLEHLNISSDYLRYPGFHHELSSMFHSGGFRNLQSSSLCMDLTQGKTYRHINAVRDWDDTLLTPFLAPGINSIEAVMTLRPNAVSYMRASTITRLVLHHCQIQDFDLDGLLGATPRLCYLEYHVSVGFDWYDSHWSRSGMSRSLGLDPLLNALHHVRNTLRELITSQKFDEDSDHFQWSYGAGTPPPFRQYHELSKLKRLHTLVIPYASLLGWLPKERVAFDWHKILPTTIKNVTFTDDLWENFMADGWTDQSLMPVFSDLASRLALCKQNDQPPRFALRLLQTDTEFHAPLTNAREIESITVRATQVEGVAEGVAGVADHDRAGQTMEAGKEERERKEKATLYRLRNSDYLTYSIFTPGLALPSHATQAQFAQVYDNVVTEHNK